MAYSATLANMRGLLSDEEHRRILKLFSRAGLSMDHHQFDEDMLDRGTKAILKTRDGKLRAAVPSPIGQCVFLNDVSMEEMNAALLRHKQIMKGYARNGEGLEAFVDSSDTGYTLNNKPVETNGFDNHTADVKVLNDDTKGDGAMLNGHGHTHGSDGKAINGVPQTISHASGPEGVNGLQNGTTNGVNGHVNGQIKGKPNGVH